MGTTLFQISTSLHKQPRKITTIDSDSYHFVTQSTVSDLFSTKRAKQAERGFLDGNQTATFSAINGNGVAERLSFCVKLVPKEPPRHRIVGPALSYQTGQSLIFAATSYYGISPAFCIQV